MFESLYAAPAETEFDAQGNFVHFAGFDYRTLRICSDYGSRGLGACLGVMGPGNGFWAMGLLSGDKEKNIAMRMEEEEGPFKSRKAYAFVGVK